jgi:biopolymer transport protein ExbD
MLRKHRRSPRLFSDFNTLQFACVMGMVLFVILLIFMVVPVDHHIVSVDLAKVSHPALMAGALREDAMKIMITRDGKVYFGSDLVTAYSVRENLQERLNDRGVERKVYIVTDMRARWGIVEEVLDSVRSAGILRVAFLVNQRRS